MQHPFDLVHCDIWGLYHIITVSDYRYFLTLVDDCTRFTWVFLFRHKSDVTLILPRFLSLIENQFNSKVKQFRSDNAKGLTFNALFPEKGILHQYSCIDTPQQNSVVERKHQHLLNVTRALFFQPKLLIQFSSDCLLATTFLINQTPSTLLGHKTPYEQLYNKIPDYASLRVFGCLVFASTLSAHRTKFASKAKPSVFMGYPPGMKGYNLDDLHTKQFFISRDVIFYETIFLFHFIPYDPSHLTDPFPE